jgi:hypothetical protein
MWQSILFRILTLLSWVSDLLSDLLSMFHTGHDRRRCNRQESLMTVIILQGRLTLTEVNEAWEGIRLSILF